MRKKILLGVAIFLLGGVSTIFAQSMNIFPDVQPDAWYYEDVVNMVEWDVIRGNDDGTFKPEANVNRAELSAMWNRYEKHVDELIDEKIASLNISQGEYGSGLTEHHDRLNEIESEIIAINESLGNLWLNMADKYYYRALVLSEEKSINGWLSMLSGVDEVNDYPDCSEITKLKDVAQTTLNIAIEYGVTLASPSVVDIIEGLEETCDALDEIYK